MVGTKKDRQETLDSPYSLGQFYSAGRNWIRHDEGPPIFGIRKIHPGKSFTGTVSQISNTGKVSLKLQHLTEQRCEMCFLKVFFSIFMSLFPKGNWNVFENILLLIQNVSSINFWESTFGTIMIRVIENLHGHFSIFTLAA